MAKQEKFSLVKFSQGFISPVTNAKNVQFLLWLLIIIFIIITIWRAFFMKNQTQIQKLNIWPLSFSTVTYVPQQQQKQEVKKRPWWLPILFVEGYGFTETTGMSNSRTGVGGRAGGRLEW